MNGVKSLSCPELRTRDFLISYSNIFLCLLECLLNDNEKSIWRLVLVKKVALMYVLWR